MNIMFFSGFIWKASAESHSSSPDIFNCGETYDLLPWKRPQWLWIRLGQSNGAQDELLG